MAKTLNALIYRHTPSVISERRMIDVATIPPHKRAWWRPIVTVGDDPFNSATHKKTGPVTTIEADRVVDTYTVTALTAQELDAIKESRLPSADGIQFRVLFNHENRIRAIELKQPVTAEQFRNALKAML